MKSTASIVRGYQCDGYQHMNNARYLEVLEDARWDYLGPILEKGYFEKNNLIFMVVRINISYKYPAVLHDLLETDVKLLNYGNASMTVQQTVYNKTRDKVSAIAEVTFVLFDTLKEKAVFINEEIKNMFDQLNG